MNWWQRFSMNSNFVKRNFEFITGNGFFNKNSGGYNAWNLNLSKRIFGLPVFGLGFLLYHQNLIFGSFEKEIQFGDQNLRKNDIEGRIEWLEYPANNPIEDRLTFGNFQSIKGFSAIVFDGHGGWQMSQYASENLHQFIDDELAELSKANQVHNEDNVKFAITKAFNKVENNFLNVAREAYKLGFYKKSG